MAMQKPNSHASLVRADSDAYVREKKLEWCMCISHKMCWFLTRKNQEEIALCITTYVLCLCYDNLCLMSYAMTTYAHINLTLSRVP